MSEHVVGIVPDEKYGEKVQYATGAVRSADAEDTRYDLITPIGMQRVAQIYQHASSYFEDEDCSEGESLAAAIECVYWYLSGRDQIETESDPVLNSTLPFATAMLCECFAADLIPDTRDVTVDSDSPRYDMIPPKAVEAAAAAYAEGAVKYSAYNWEKGMPVSDLLNHALRHMYKHQMQDKSEPHLGHAVWNMLAAMHMEVMRPDLNQNRRRPGCLPPEAVLKQ